MPSFYGIQKDCSAIVSKLKHLLHERLDDKESSAAIVAETVDLLLELGESPEVLCQQFLEKYGAGLLFMTSFKYFVAL